MNPDRPQQTDKISGFKVIIIGSGFSGICMGIKLKRAGISDFIILEKASSLGGTWRENTYPGAECDIPSLLYQYSFEQSYAWQSKWSSQAQILNYQISTASKYGLTPHFHFSKTLKSAFYDENHLRWQLNVADGSVYHAQHIITAVGQLHHSSRPCFKDQESYQGEQFHCAHWNHSIDLHNKRVAVVGNAASAVQFIPEIAPLVSHLSVYQRSANWMLPKRNRRYTKFEHWLWQALPVVPKLARKGYWIAAERMLFPAIQGNRFCRWLLTMVCLASLRLWIKDPELRKCLTPTYSLGAKRTLFSHQYYQALTRDNVELAVTGIRKFTTSGLVRSNNERSDYDVIIYATGFKTNPFLLELEVRGRAGQSIHQTWSDGASAYLGLAVHGFPNLHMLYGPNTNLGHNSIIAMIEAQADYIVRAVQKLDQDGLTTMEVSEQALNLYNQEVQTELSKLAFSEIDSSWYIDGNKITNNWFANAAAYQRRLATEDWDNYSFG